MKATSHNFAANARDALADDALQQALATMKVGFVARRAEARARLPEFDALRDQAKAIKDHTLAHLDHYLEAFADNFRAAGGHVHWARDGAEATTAIRAICRKAEARKIIKGKSMVAEEIALNTALEEDGLEVTETDLGEYIIQLRNEAPSHIIAPAVHVLRDQVAADFRARHTELDPQRDLGSRRSIVQEARTVLRQKFLAGDVGITGANFLIAETGSSVIVTNEGNGDLTQTLPRVHIIVASLEKIVPTLEDASAILRVLARSGTGQEFSAYTSFATGPRRADDADGPEECHVVLLDNGRTDMLGSEFQDMLRCIRCGACMNHCPVYGAVGGHAYGWVYPGPMGAVLTPGLIGVADAGHLPNASTFCGRCEDVCPMRIPLPRMMRAYRAREYAAHLAPVTTRIGLGVWGFFALRPWLYRPAARLAGAVLSRLGRGRGRLRRLPGAGGWTGHRDLPTPAGPGFRQLWAAHQATNASNATNPTGKASPES